MPEKVMYVQPHAVHFEIKERADLDKFISFLNRKVFNRQDRTAELLVEVWREIKISAPKPPD